jgi:hypothetical protein
MAKLGKTNAGSVPESVPSLKSRGLKNPMPADYDLAQSQPDMTKSNDGSKGGAGSPPASGKRAPGDMA